MKKSEGEQSEIEEDGMEDIETDMGEVDQSEGGEIDHIEDCEKIIPIFPVIVTFSTYEHPPIAAFYPLYTS